MKYAAVFAFILAGAVATASAQPEPTEPSGRVSYTDQAAPAKPAAAQQGSEVQLASPTPASHGTEFIVVGRDAGQFSQLRLAATSGKVIVAASASSSMTARSRRSTSTRSSTATAGKDATVTVKAATAIDHITVTTEPGHGQYALYGTAAHGNLTAQ